MKTKNNMKREIFYMGKWNDVGDTYIDLEGKEWKVKFIGADSTAKVVRKTKFLRKEVSMTIIGRVRIKK